MSWDLEGHIFSAFFYFFFLLLSFPARNLIIVKIFFLKKLLYRFFRFLILFFIKSIIASQITLFCYCGISILSCPLPSKQLTWLGTVISAKYCPGVIPAIGSTSPVKSVSFPVVSRRYTPLTEPTCSGALTFTLIFRESPTESIHDIIHFK